MKEDARLRNVSKYNGAVSMFLIYSPDGTATSMVQEVGALRGMAGVEERLKVVKSCSCGALPIHLFRHFCCSMYHLATMHSITDRGREVQTDGQTDRRQYHANSRILRAVRSANEVSRLEWHSKQHNMTAWPRQQKSCCWWRVRSLDVRRSRSERESRWLGTCMTEVLRWCWRCLDRGHPELVVRRDPCLLEYRSSASSRNKELLSDHDIVSNSASPSHRTFYRICNGRHFSSSWRKMQLHQLSRMLNFKMFPDHKHGLSFIHGLLYDIRENADVITNIKWIT